MASVASSQGESVDGKWHARNRVLSVVRIKPQGAIAAAQDDKPALVATSNKAVTFQTSATERATSRFDLVLGPEATNKDVYDSLAEPCLQAVQDGFNISSECRPQ
jgi:hypothetical protein